MPKLKLVSITCMQTDESDKDEIYLKVGEKKIWPVKSKFYPIDTDEEAAINLGFNVKAGKVCIDLWELDFISSNEILGSFIFEIDQSGSYSEMMSNLKGEASYILNYDVL
ncbi:hypothetical protein [Ekhidna sp.]|uniref:hypothetical protein n=1 Tax=Ekhidna sp. TaxID=2608089 RepID=UPI003B5061CC